MRRDGGDGPVVSWRLGVLTNAAFTGLITVALPLLLAAHGESKVHIAFFFVLTAFTAATLNLAVGRRVRALDSRWVISGSAGTAAFGLLVIALLPPSTMSWAIYPAGMGVAAMSLVYPQYVELAHRRSARTAARTVGLLRSLYVAGYVTGLGIFAVASELATVFGPALRPVHVAFGLAVLNSAIAWLGRSAGAGTPATTAVAATTPVRGRVVLFGAAVAVVLLRAADSLRGVYLPLYATDIGVDGTGVSILFAVTAVVESAILVPLSVLSDRYGSRRTLVAVCVAGMLAFFVIASGMSYALLVGSQVIYAIFAAGFQSVGMVLLGEALRSGVGGGAALYTALVQAGSTVGILAPLVVPGYSPAAFLIATAFCGVAGLLLVVDRLPTRLRG